MRCTPEARVALEAFTDELEPRLDADKPGDLAWCAALGSKLPGQIARIAGLLELATSRPGLVTIESTQRALVMAPYFIPHAAGALTMAGEKPGLRDARQLLRWLRDHAQREFTEREVYRSNFHEDTARAAEACRIAETYGWIRQLDVSSRTTRYEVHPALLGLSALSAMADTQDKHLKNTSSLSIGSTKPSTGNRLAEVVTNTATTNFHTDTPTKPTTGDNDDQSRDPLDPEDIAAGLIPTGLSLDGTLDYGVPHEDAPPPLDHDPGEPIDLDEWFAGINPHPSANPVYGKPTWENAEVPLAVLEADPGSSIPDEGEEL